MKMEWDTHKLCPVIGHPPTKLLDNSIKCTEQYIEVHACPFCNTLNIVKLTDTGIDTWLCTYCDIWFKHPTIYRIPEYESQI
jgi:ribosomal protein L37AE/L43A